MYAGIVLTGDDLILPSVFCNMTQGVKLINNSEKMFKEFASGTCCVISGPVMVTRCLALQRFLSQVRYNL